MLRRRFGHPLGSAMCVLALLLCSTAVRAQNAKKREVSGTVLDVDGQPVANASVTVTGGGPTTTTAADGTFKLTVAPTNLTIEVSADGLTSRQVQLIAAPTPLQLSLVLVKPAPPPPVETRMVGGVVSDPGHAPLAGVKVRVHGTSIETVTGADGSFTLPGVAVAEVVLDVEAPNQPPTSVTLPQDKAVAAITVGEVKQAPPPPTTRTIRGKVIDPASKEPIAAAQVQVVGTGTLMFSEADGSFVIEGVGLGPVQLDVSAPEHESHVLEVPAGKDTIEIPLGLAQGEQIVIEGRAPVIVKQNQANGASVIDGKDLNRVAAATLDEAMNGKLAGANLQSNSGAPGGGAQLRLRGISTINGQSSPLYVIDGVIVSNVSIPSGANALTAAAAGGSSSNQDNAVNRIADLNPNDIETLEVLKGASAAALYGSKAANGVVVITTKRGRNGENRASVTQRFGVSQVSNTLGARTFTSVGDVKAAFCSPKDTPAKCDASPVVQAFNASSGRTYDHEAELVHTPFASETLGSVSGGTDSGNYYGSVLVADDPGVVIGTFYRKQTGRIAVGARFGDRVRLGFTTNVIHSTSDRGLTNNDNNGVSNYVVLSSTPSFLDLRPQGGVYPSNPAIGSGANPIQTVNLLQNREEVWRLITGASASVDAYTSRDGASKVRALGNIGVDSFQQKNNLLSPSGLTFEPSDGLDGTSIDATSTNLNWNVGAGAVWTYKPQSGKYRSALSGGLTYEAVDLNSVYVVAQGLTAGQPNVSSGALIRPAQARLQTKENGLYLQEELALLDDQLSVLGGLLGERSSLNGDTDKYYLFPKVAAVYSLIKPSKAGQPKIFDQFDSLRVRGAYGEAGNRPNYGYKFTPLVTTSNIDGNPGVILTGPQGALAGDPNIKPEHQREFELGVDAALKDQRAVVELTGYQRNISDLLLQRALAPSTGFTTQFLNGGGLRNRGLEAAVQVRPISSKLAEWTSRATLTLNRSEITSLPAGITPFNIGQAGFGAGLGAFRIEPGKSATQIVSTIDKNSTLAVAGNGEPDFRIGWSNVVTAGGFTFSALLDWQHGSNIINLTRLLYDGASNSPDVAAAAERIKSFGAGDPRPYIEDASFVKIREISVTYSVPKRLTAQLGSLKTLDFSLSGRNLFTFTGYSGLDPEVSNFGGQSIGRNYDVAPYPPSRTFWLSITAGI
jgi:TonB-linked SusC/RagA family outer membrane protein